jgi:hypothetical protein
MLVNVGALREDGEQLDLIILEQAGLQFAF